MQFIPCHQVLHTAVLISAGLVLEVNSLDDVKRSAVLVCHDEIDDFELIGYVHQGQVKCEFMDLCSFGDVFEEVLEVGDEVTDCGGVDGFEVDVEVVELKEAGIVLVDL